MRAGDGVLGSADRCNHYHPPADLLRARGVAGRVDVLSLPLPGGAATASPAAASASLHTPRRADPPAACWMDGPIIPPRISEAQFAKTQGRAPGENMTNKDGIVGPQAGSRRGRAQRGAASQWTTPSYFMSFPPCRISCVESVPRLCIPLAATS